MGPDFFQKVAKFCLRRFRPPFRFRSCRHLLPDKHVRIADIDHRSVDWPEPGDVEPVHRISRRQERAGTLPLSWRNRPGLACSRHTRNTVVAFLQRPSTFDRHFAIKHTIKVGIPDPYYGDRRCRLHHVFPYREGADAGRKIPQRAKIDDGFVDFDLTECVAEMYLGAGIIFRRRADDADLLVKGSAPPGRQSDVGQMTEDR